MDGQAAGGSTPLSYTAKSNTSVEFKKIATAGTDNLRYGWENAVQAASIAVLPGQKH